MLFHVERINAYRFGKMATYHSIPRHKSTVDRWKYANGETPSNIKISSWNVNGIRSVIKKGKLQEYLCKYDPDIICVSQTKIDLEGYKKQRLNQIQCLQNYNQYWNFCKVSSGYSGVAVFSKYKPIKAEQDFQCGYLSLEGRCLTLQFENFYLINVYKPNSGNFLDRLEQRTVIYDKNFLQYANQLKKYKNVIIVGDMNVAHQEIDLANPKVNKKSPGFTMQQRSTFNEMILSGFIDTFRYLYPLKIQYTWWSTRALARAKNVGWRIDYILTNNENIIKDSKIEDQFEGSDHCPIHALFQFR